jgi:hypothetical protein
MSFMNDVIADGNTKAGQTVNISFALIANATAGSDDGMGNITSEGMGIILGTLNVTQQVNTTGSAHASQNGELFALLGNTWGDAWSGDEHAWTKSNAVGMISIDDNTMNAGSSTDAFQSLSIAGLSGSASAGSTDGTNTTEIGAEIGGGDLSGLLQMDLSEIDISDIGDIIEELGGGYLNMDQQANISGSAHATQNGLIVATKGHTWGEATSGTNRSWTSANVTAGILTMDDNTMTAATNTMGLQKVQIIGLTSNSSGDAWVGSEDGINYAKVGAGFSGIGSLSEGWFILPYGYMSQDTRTTTSTFAHQVGYIITTGSTLGNSWTRIEAGNNSGRLVYSLTLGRSGAIWERNGTAYSSPDYSEAYEYKTRVLGSTNTSAYAFSGTADGPIYSNSGTTRAKAWATNTNRDALFV